MRLLHLTRFDLEKPLVYSTLVSCLVTLALVLAPASAVGSGDEGVRHATITAAHGDHAVVSFGDSASGKVEIRGVLRGADNQPLKKVVVRLVRFEPSSGHRLTTLSLDDLLQPDKVTVFATDRRETANNGEFSLVAHSPGSYSFQVDWSGLPDQERVHWNLEIDEGATSRAAPADR